MKRNVIIVLFIALAFISNPGVDEHVAAAIKKEIPYGIFGDSDSFVAIALHAGLKREILYENYLLFSLATFGNDGPITAGMFGFVKAF